MQQVIYVLYNLLYYILLYYILLYYILLYYILLYCVGELILHRANQLRLLFADTDSLAYAVQTDDIFRDMADDAASRYDFNEYPLDHPLKDTSNRKALGFFKDELNSSAYARICWTASKMLRLSLYGYSG